MTKFASPISPIARRPTPRPGGLGMARPSALGLPAARPLLAGLVLLAAMLLLAGPAWGAAGAAQLEKLEAFELLDQNGRPASIAQSGKTTLVYFYRGEW